MCFLAFTLRRDNQEPHTHKEQDDGQFLPIILLFVGMWFLIIAPQRKRQKAHDQMLSELKSGDEIITSGGVYGTITNVKDDRFIVRIADNTKIELGKGFVASKVAAKEAE